MVCMPFDWRYQSHYCSHKCSNWIKGIAMNWSWNWLNGIPSPGGIILIPKSVRAASFEWGILETGLSQIHMLSVERRYFSIPIREMCHHVSDWYHWWSGMYHVLTRVNEVSSYIFYITVLRHQYKDVIKKEINCSWTDCFTRRAHPWHALLSIIVRIPLIHIFATFPMNNK